MDFYNLEPEVIEKGEILVLGVEDLFVNGVGTNTKEGMVSVYKLLNSKGREYNDAISKYVKDRTTTIGINWPSSGSKSNSPVFEFPDGSHDELYHMAGYEITDVFDVPEGMKIRIIPPSKYIKFSCESAPDAETGKAKRVNWAPLFDEGYRNFKKNNCLGYKEKEYSLEIGYRSNGTTIDKYELLIAVE
jgi:predicted transcriptional regulator YdeE